MKKLLNIRQRGYDLLQISLGIAITLGLMVGGLMLFNQVQASSELSEKTRVAVAVSSEVRAQYRTAADYSALSSDTTNPVILETDAFVVRSGMPISMFSNLALAPIAGTPQNFQLAFSGLNETVCERMEVADLGPNSTAVCDAGAGTLTVTYTR